MQDNETLHRDLSETGIDLEGVRRLFKRFCGFVARDRLSELSSEAQPETVAEVDLTAAFAENLLRVRGKVACTVRRMCARCLTEFSSRVFAEVDRLFVPGSDPAEADSCQEMVEERTYLDGHPLSIAAVVEEELLLALPMIPVCQQACAGLCPTCGADRNQEKCSCVETTTEGPFAVLKNLKTV
ncbi:MAG: DUF177 domain-containing protein [Magnetococcales bacterium]|nr:DUF177 domain-containing protein [Magnetococcales bacterium]